MGDRGIIRWQLRWSEREVDRRVNIFECLRDQATLDAWRKVAKGPRGIKYRKAHV